MSRNFRLDDEENEKNLITTRILWLAGLEPGVNAGGAVDTYERYIYIHGTNHEHRLGAPASSECQRIFSKTAGSQSHRAESKNVSSPFSTKPLPHRFSSITGRSAHDSSADVARQSSADERSGRTAAAMRGGRM